MLIDPGFQGVNRLFALSFEDENGRESSKRYNLPTVEKKDYNVIIDGRSFFDQTVKNDVRITFEKLQLVKVMITQLDVYQIIPILKNTIS